MYYYTTPEYSVALNAKVGSSSLARAIIRQFYPEQNQRILLTKTPPHILENDQQWHWLCPGTRIPTLPVVLFVRDPIERFISACQQVIVTQQDLDYAINSLLYDTLFIRSNSNFTEQDIAQTNNQRLQEYNANNDPNKPPFRRRGYLRDNIHFWFQHSYILSYAHCFKFPEHIQQCLQFLNIDIGFPNVNSAKYPKVTLSDNQLVKIVQYYQKDIELYNLISTHNTIIENKDNDLKILSH